MGSTTTISVDESTLRRFNAERQSDQYEISQDAFLNELLDCWNGQLKDQSDGVNPDLVAEATVDLLVTELGDGLTVNADLETEIRRLREQVERIPEDTADQLGARFS